METGDRDRDLDCRADDDDNGMEEVVVVGPWCSGRRRCGRFRLDSRGLLQASVGG